MESTLRTVNVDGEVVSETPFTECGSGETPKKTMSNVWNHVAMEKPHDPNERPSTAINNTRSRSVSRKGRKRERSADRRSVDGKDGMDIDGDRPSKKQRRSVSMSSSRSMSRPLHEVVPGEGLRDSAQKIKAIKIARKSMKKRNKQARRGEADRVIPTLKPKHLYSGKRSKGKTHRR